MQGVVIIGTNDISNLIVDGTYKMDSKDVYESWLDGNYVEHRIITAQKVSGSFDVALSNKNNCTLVQFKAIMTAADNNGAINAAVSLTNTGAVKAIEAYYKLSSQEHIRQADGSFLDVLTVELQER